MNLNPARGIEPGKIRPAVVIQTDLLNSLDHPSTLICLVASQLSEEENMLGVRVTENPTSRIQNSEIVVDQIRTLNNYRFLEKFGKLHAEKTLELRDKLGAVMDF